MAKWGRNAKCSNIHACKIRSKVRLETRKEEGQREAKRNHTSQSKSGQGRNEMRKRESIFPDTNSEGKGLLSVNTNGGKSKEQED
jgi:hypothetical protein